MVTRIFQTVLALAVVLALASFAIAFGGGGGGCGEGTCSDCHSMNQDEAEKLLTGLVEKVHGVDFSIVPGLWKVDIEKKKKRGLVFIDFSKSYIISGRIVRLTDWTDVTPGAKAEVKKKVDLSLLPVDHILLLGRSEAATKVFVFTDPQCPYCTKLHTELKEVVKINPDIAFSMMLYPLKIHPDAYRISKSIVCEESLELLEDSFAGKAVPDPGCETEVIDQTLSLAGDLGIRSTPTMVFPDGSVISGYRPAEKILQLLTETPDQQD